MHFIVLALVGLAAFVYVLKNAPGLVSLLLGLAWYGAIAAVGGVAAALLANGLGIHDAGPGLGLAALGAIAAPLAWFAFCKKVFTPKTQA